MCFKMLMWTILVLGSYLQGAYAQSVKSTSSTSTYTSIISNTATIKTSLVESSSQSIPPTISITTILTAKLPSAESSTAGPTIPAKTEASGPSTNSIPTDPQSATVSIKIPENKDTSNISTLASITQFPSTSVTASTILTSNVTKGTDAPSDQSTLKDSPDTVTISSPTEFNITTTTKESLNFTADEIPTTNSETAETATTAAAEAAATAATTTSAKATTTSTKATTTSAAAATTSAKATTTSAKATTTSVTAAAPAAAPAAPAATTTRTAATRTTTRTAAAARNTTSTITTTTSIKPQPQAMEPKLIPREITPNGNGNDYEKLCALLIKMNGKTVNCTMNGREIDGFFRVESIQLPSLPSGKDQKHPTPATPTKPVDSGEPTEKQAEDTRMTLIAILASCGALALILIAFAVYCSCHRLSYRKNQQHLTEELQTVENGYHDNPTLEVMEVQEKKFALEKKLALNGEFNDSWIVPFDNLARDDIPDEEDTHL